LLYNCQLLCFWRLAQSIVVICAIISHNDALIS
jgi:hypothetical protein